VQLLQDLGIDFKSLAINFGAVLLILWLLSKLFFRPFGQLLSERGEHIRQQLAEAEAARKQAKQDMAEMAERHRQAEEDLAREVEKQRQAAREEAQKIMEEANRLARERRRHAEEQLQREVAEARQHLRAETAGLATDLAHRALARALGPAEREQSVEAAVRLVEQLAEQESN
jgi:F0F1-type ATP synthase membrane subunit b/b'